MILTLQLVETQALLSLQMAKHLHRGGPQRGGYIFAAEVGKRCNARVGTHSDADFFNQRGEGKRHIALSGLVIGGRATFHVHSARLDHRNPVRGRDQLMAYFQLGQPQPSLQIQGDPFADIHLISRKLPVANRI